MASPVLVGAVTVLVACIAVLIAVQANKGLPFVPTYDVSAEIPGGANLVVGNEVRVGGFRAGVIQKIRPGVSTRGNQRAIAIIDMKIDKKIEPIPVNSVISIRPRSALGLKYVDLTLGKSKRMLANGATLPLQQAKKPIELDEFFSTYDAKTRVAQRTVFEGYGTALSGRGQSINRAIEGLVPFVTHLEPVMRTLSDPDTGLDRFFRQAGRTSAQLAPVARTYASLFTNLATTFEALSRHPERLRGTVERAAPTLDAAIRSFPVQRPFLRDTRVLARNLEPVAEEIERSLPVTSSAFRVGAPVLRKAPPFYRRTGEVFRSVRDLTRNPNTLLALKDLRNTLTVVAPLITYIAPYQTVCNYWNYYWTGLGEHVSEKTPFGTGQRSNAKTANNTQDNRLNATDAEVPVDVPFNQDPQNAREAPTPNAAELQALHNGAYWTAIDAQGNPDCLTGQRGYLDGPLVTTGRYGPKEPGGQHVVLDNDYPGLSGGTYKTRELGIKNLKDVP